MISKWSQKLLATYVTFMLTLTSMGGMYAAAVYADPVSGQQTAGAPAEQVSKDQKTTDASAGRVSKDQKTTGGVTEQVSKDQIKQPQKAALGGLLAVGLLSMMGRHGSGSNNNGGSGGKSYIGSNTPGNLGSTAQNGLGSAQSNSSSANSGSAGVTAKPAMTAEEMQLIGLINNERSKEGLGLLRINNAVANVARAHSQDMIVKNYFDHYDLNGGNPFTRLSSAGIGYTAAGENIAINISVPNAHQAFMNSPGHRANVLDSDYTQVGVGIMHSGSRIWVTEDFIG